MERTRENIRSALFKPVAGGWVFRSPNPWIFGDTPHYFVNDAQKAQLEEIVVPKRPAVLVGLVIVGILAWVVIAATIVWAFGSGQDNPTVKDLFAMAVLIILPLFGLVPIIGWIQRRRVQPILVGAPLTNERISNVELRQRVQSMATVRQALNACISSVFASNAMTGAAIVHLVLHQYYQASFWALLAFGFGLLTIRWYRLVLEKAGER